MVFTKEQVINALHKKEVAYSPWGINSNNRIQLQIQKIYPIKKGMKVVRIFQNDQFPIFGKVYIVKRNSHNEQFYIEDETYTDNCQICRFIPLDWIQKERKEFLPDWL